LEKFEADILKAMRKDGWDGSENTNELQWSFFGALFYSIIVITTIGELKTQASEARLSDSVNLILEAYYLNTEAFFWH